MNLMKIIIAMDSFKGCLSSTEAGREIAAGIRDVLPGAEIILLPLADGGEGTVDALIAATGGEQRRVEVTGPLGEPVSAIYGILGSGRIAVIEVAAACGLPLVPTGRRNPLLTTSRGVGEIIMDALERGCREFIIGLGGSATNDAGLGMLQALGWRFRDSNGDCVGRGGQALCTVQSIDGSGVHPALQECVFRIACDVDNPLYGPEGAAFIFAPQKGAGPKMVKLLDEGLQHFARIALRELAANIADIPGAGAAGGLGAALAGFLGGKLESGVELIMDSLQLNRQLQGASLVITGEGRLDGQTSRGKAPLGIARLAALQQIPVIALAGNVQEAASRMNELGITAYFPIISRPMTLEEAMQPEQAAAHLRVTARQLLLLLRATSPVFSPR
jgi:glycerate 2-kinase